MGDEENCDVRQGDLRRATEGVATRGVEICDGRQKALRRVVKRFVTGGERRCDGWREVKSGRWSVSGRVVRVGKRADVGWRLRWGGTIFAFLIRY